MRQGKEAITLQSKPVAEAGACPANQGIQTPMPNIGSVLKSEMSRVARKELRTETQQLKKTVTQYRGQIAQLRRRLQALEAQVKRLARGGGRAVAAPAEEEDDSPSLRFSAKGLAAQRKRLGLSAASIARILGVSALSVYKWESGKTRPRARQLEAIAGLRKMGKREATARLAG
jgi:DNA-binding transcriptional regulator YiaG